ncbi:glycoside hydrolase family 16 protein [Pseudonocardia sp. GCM10023141]|uniref:glycoside hydrolase family 16 protein n=1 Tax=Pseudonocardia sp. GCM10023141 TaxID=3252653 RepID=UPI0036D3BCDB
MRRSAAVRPLFTIVAAGVLLAGVSQAAVVQPSTVASRVTLVDSAKPVPTPPPSAVPTTAAAPSAAPGPATATPKTAAPPTSGAHPGNVPAVGPNSTYLFDDEFDDNVVDQNAWGVLNRGGDASNNEAQCYKPSNVAETGGSLTIKSLVDSSCKGYKYTSGMVQWKTFKFHYGSIEIRAKQSGGTGSWPAQWLLGSDCQQANMTTEENSFGCNWPHPGSDEIDIAEFKTDGSTVNWQNVISGDSGFKTCKPTVSDASQNWHVYGLTWRANSLIWQVDGKTTCTQTDAVPTKPMFLIMNNAMGGDGGGHVEESDFPQQLQIDYVRVKAM